MKPARETLADLESINSLRMWQRMRSPLTHALLDRCHRLLQTLADEADRGALEFMVVKLASSANRALEAGPETQRAAEEMLSRFGG